MTIPFEYKVAFRRVMLDFENSVLHEYDRLTEYTELCIPYICKRTNLSQDEAKKRLCRPTVLSEHWARNRVAWYDEYQLSWPVSTSSEPLELKPITICTLCANVSTLLTLARLIKNYENIGVDVRCRFATPMDYWLSDSLLDDVDIFVTELSAPIICGIDECNKYELAFPIHITDEGVIYKNKDSWRRDSLRQGRVGNPIVTIGTSSLSHARTIYGKKTNEGFDFLKSTKEWQNIVGTLGNDDKLFVWEPWLSMFKERYRDNGLYAHTNGWFIMGMFVNSNTLYNMDRQPQIIFFFDAFIKEWRNTFKNRDFLGEEDIYELHEFDGWHTTFFNTILSSIGYLEAEHQIEKRDKIIMIFNEKIKKYCSDSNDITYINTIERDVVKGLYKLQEDKINLALSCLDRLAKDRKIQPTEKATEFMYCINSKLPKSRFGEFKEWLIG